jgi:catechol 2,3-dioxygenase-like lactoylglutathione lyase family enzyme
MSILASAKANAIVPVADIDRARTWWVDTLGLKVVQDSDAGLILEAGSGTRIVFYESEGAGKAPNSIVDFTVDDIEGAVDALSAKGISFERYDSIEADDKGIADMGPMRCAWIVDPDGNSIAISQFVTVNA